uniref:Protein kinase domain-containing protein n=1 Tax=Noctiluca scintillans TaxID=2966 RepID=A0A7S1F249_NOCSC
MGNKLLSYLTPDFPEEYTPSGYEEGELIGKGRYSVVKVCWKNDKKYAMKIINVDMGRSGLIDRVKEEISVHLALAEHQRIVKLMDVHDSMMLGVVRLVMEYCDGGDLFERIREKTYYPDAEARVCVRHVLDAVDFMHSKAIMHRDLKPENILLVDRSNCTNIKVSDFGLAKQSRKGEPRSASVVGSYFYLAPEVVKKQEYGKEVDLWSIGVICFVMLTGSLPFYHPELPELYKLILERDINVPEPIKHNVVDNAMDFMLSLMQTCASDRPKAEHALSHPWLSGDSSVCLSTA